MTFSTFSGNSQWIEINYGGAFLFTNLHDIMVNFFIFPKRMVQLFRDLNAMHLKKQLQPPAL